MIKHALRSSLLLYLLFVSSHARAEFSVAAATGLNVCTPDGAADCGEIWPSGFLAAEVEFRFFTYVGFGLDYDYGWLSPEASGQSVAVTHFMPTLRVHYPISSAALDVYLGIGMGYASIKAENDARAYYTFTTFWASVKTTLGVLYDLGGGLAVGGKFDLFFHSAGERCLLHPLGQTNCNLDGDTFDLSQIGAVLRYTP